LLVALGAMAIKSQFLLQAERTRSQFLQTQLDWRVPRQAYIVVDYAAAGGHFTSQMDIAISGSLYLTNFGKPLRCRGELIEMSTESVVSVTFFEATPNPQSTFQLYFNTSLPGTAILQPGSYLVKVVLLGDGERDLASCIKQIKIL
jgi:hypothetical protein